MKLLLDTHLLLWALAEPEKLGAEVRALLEDPENEVLFSAASIWEVAIKAGLGRPDFAVRPEEVAQAALEAGFAELPEPAEPVLADDPDELEDGADDEPDDAPADEPAGRDGDELLADALGRLAVAAAAAAAAACCWA